MKVAITKIVDFAGKDGRKWTKIHFIKEDGEVGEKMFPNGAHPGLGDADPVSLPESAFAWTLSFDERGRLTEIE